VPVLPTRGEQFRKKAKKGVRAAPVVNLEVECGSKSEMR